MDTNREMKRQLPFIIITLLFVTVSFLDRLIPKGMFFDGVIYATVAKNMAEGLGSFWLPYYGHGAYFWEHPPLMFGLQSVVFRVFGNLYFTEKIYCFIVWLFTVGLIRKLWNASSSPERKHFFWLPLLMWGISSTILWAYPNNVLECTMTVFDIVAVLLLMQAMQKLRRANVYIIAGAVAIVSAFLVKGPVGLFPMAVPAVHWLACRKHAISYAIDKTAFLFLCVAFLFVALFAFDGPRYLLTNYLNDQLFNSLAGKREQVESSLGRLQLLVYLLTEMLPAIVLTVLLFGMGKLLKAKSGNYTETHGKNALFFLLMGLCASLPIMVSIKQRSFYLVPSIPFFAIGLALLIYPSIVGLTNKYTLPAKASRYFTVLSGIITIACIPYLWQKTDEIGREKELITDVAIIAKVIPPADTVGMCPDMVWDFPFLAYTARYSGAQVKWPIVARNLIVNREMCAEGFVDSIVGRGYRKVDIATVKYDLYRNKSIPDPRRKLRK